MENKMQKITTFLTYDDQAEQAAIFYTSLFKDSKIENVMRAGDAVMGVSFQLAGQHYNALNGGPSFTFTEGISLFVNCETQAEVNELWEKLTSNGGEESRCGWLKDKFGVSWQIIPTALGEMLGDKDPEKAGRVMQAMLKMNKIEIKELKDAYDNK
jgi:predicted 3-demethylubiquinone-9 3-methyltransferase (glyoxalase superfamily)